MSFPRYAAEVFLWYMGCMDNGITNPERQIETKRKRKKKKEKKNNSPKHEKELTSQLLKDYCKGTVSGDVVFHRFR